MLKKVSQLGARAPPPPLPPGKRFRSEMSKRGEKVPPRNVGKKGCACLSAQIRQISNESSEINKQVILAFIFVFIVCRTVSVRLFRSSGTGPNVF